MRFFARTVVFTALQFAALALSLVPDLGGQATTKRPQAVMRQEVNSGARTLIGIQYEHWFYGSRSWDTAEAIPLLGKYTTDESTVAEHFHEFQKLGIDWLLIDWSNMLWASPQWEQHVGDTKRLEETTDVLFKTALDLHRKGKYAPKLVFMLGLQNGPPVPDGESRINNVLQWIEKHYLDRPEYSDLWLYYTGKPLLTVLYWPPDPCHTLAEVASSLHASRWTIRWMASQLQDNHADSCGMWSWMDGTIPQIVTVRGQSPEEIVVTPASFRLPGTGTGWIAPSAIPRDHGVIYLRSWRAAFESRPTFIQIHQWNEFTGQKDNAGLPVDYWVPTSINSKTSSTVYADEYDLDRSDDIEPTNMNACTMRGCGGWGWYYYNMTRALISLYRGETPDITVLALSGSSSEQVVQGHSLLLRWEYLGKSPTGFRIYVDGKRIADVANVKEFRLDLSNLTQGIHHVKLLAVSAHTYFNLDMNKQARKASHPLPVESEISFRYVGDKKENR